MGRTPTYTQKHEIEICERIADGESLNSICSDDGMPGKSTVIAWLMETKQVEQENGEKISVLVRAEFADHYARARLISYQLMADTLMDIADDGRNDYMERLAKNGEMEHVVDHEHIQRSRLRCDKRQWFLSKVLPKIYGDHVQVTQDVKVTGTIEHKAVESMNFGQVRDQRVKLKVIGSNVPEDE